MLTCSLGEYDGNCVALPFAENFGWGGELNLQYTFEKLFCAPGGGGYPPERVVPEQRNKKILDQVKEVTHTDMVTILKNLDRELVRVLYPVPGLRSISLQTASATRSLRQ